MLCVFGIYWVHCLVGRRLWWDFLMGSDKGRSRLESHLGVETFCWFEEIECFRWIFIDQVLFAAFSTGADFLVIQCHPLPNRILRDSAQRFRSPKGNPRGASHCCGRQSCVFVTHLCGKHWIFLDGTGGCFGFFVWNPSWKIQSNHFLSP